MNLFSIQLHTFDTEVASAWHKAFAGVTDVTIIEGDILEGRSDAVISPANSFGYMDGGIDLAYLRFFGTQLQSQVQARIRGDFHGELPVGQAAIVSTSHEFIPFLVVALTMRIPDKIEFAERIDRRSTALCQLSPRRSGPSSHPNRGVRFFGRSMPNSKGQ